MAPSISVAEYFAGKSVLITGATGFMGIVLVEKLLRTCPDVKTLYLLIRTKKGVSVEERLQNYLNDEIFSRVYAECPRNIHKVRLVAGDICEDQLGISSSDLEELQRECQVIFHCAASVRFDLFIRDAVEINVNGTARILKLAETMKNLEVFLHMSTAYCHDYLDCQEEKLYPPVQNPQDVMQIAKWMDDDILKAIEDKLIRPLPNTYSFTKNLAETIVAQYEGKFTIVVARPSIVVAALREPIPGWINNLNGPTGLMVAGGKGVFRIMCSHPNLKPDLIPVDIAVNASILLAYMTALERPKELRVCNITNSGINTMSWIQMTDNLQIQSYKYPFSGCLWYPRISYYETKVFYQIQALFVHWLPALLIDMLLTVLGKKRFMINVQKRLHHGLNVLEHYMTGEWIFKNNNFRSLRHRVSKKDNEVYFTEYETLDKIQFIQNYVLGARKYCCKDSPSTLPQARRQMKLLYCLDITFNFVLLWCLLNIIYYVYTKLFLIFKIIVLGRLSTNDVLCYVAMDAFDIHQSVIL